MRAASKGVITVVALLFLIGAIVFALVQMHQLLGNSVSDGKAHSDSNAAFFMAESGLEKARSTVETALNSGTFTEASCTGVTTSAPYALPPASAALGGPRGTVSITAESTSQSGAPTCTIGGANPCTGCKVTATGTVGQAVRTVQQNIVLSTAQGTVCNGDTTDCTNCTAAQGGNCTTPRLPPQWQLNLKNPSTTLGAMGVFVLAYDQQGNNNATCAAGSNCSLQLTVPSPSSGTNSVGLQGNSVQIPAGTTYPIYQLFGKQGNSSPNVVEVGGLFQGQGTTPPVPAGPAPAGPGTSSYWSNSSGGTRGSGTNYSGAINDGTLTTTANCSAPSDSNNNTQSCTSWCSGGDTLVFSFAGKTTAIGDQLNSVTFGVNGQNLAMSPIARFPSADVTGAPASVKAEIWVLRNENLPTNTSVANVSSYKGVGRGRAGAEWTGNNNQTMLENNASGGNPLLFTVGNDFTNVTSGTIRAGDVVSASGVTCPGGICATVVSQVTPQGNEQTGGRGRYVVSGVTPVAASNGRVWTVRSTKLSLASCSLCAIAAGDSWGDSSTNVRLGTITPPVGGGTGPGLYDIDSAVYLAENSRVLVGPADAFPTTSAGSPASTTLYVATANATPLVASTTRLVNIKSAASGGLAAGTKIDTSAIPLSAPYAAVSQLTLSQAPTQSLVEATLCGGTCALFTAQPASTTFSFEPSTPSSNLREWAAGFTCLKNVTQVLAVTSSRAASTRWLEVTK